MEPMISVIVPVFNIENYVGRCIESLLNQDYANMEIIVVNDGSTDGTGSIIDKFAKLDNRVVALHKKNGGVSSARNMALGIAGGDYIGFVDGDDMVDCDMYAFLIGNMLKYDADISVCGYRNIYQDQNINTNNTGKTKIFDNIQGIKSLLEDNKFKPFMMNKLYRAELLKDIRLDETIRAGEDLLFNFHAFSKARRSVFVDEAKYNYLRRADSTIFSIKIKILMDPYLVSTEILKHIEPQSRVYPAALNRYFIIMIRILEHKKSALSEDCLHFQKEIRDKLKSELKTVLLEKGVRYRVKGEAIGVLYLYPLYYLMRNLRKLNFMKK